TILQFEFLGFFDNTFQLHIWGHLQLSAPGPASIKMSTVRRILCKFDTIHLTTDHYPPPNVDRSVKAYTNWDAERDAMNIETAIKTKGVDEVTIVNILTNCSNEQRQNITFAYQRRTKKELASALKSDLSSHLEKVIWGLLKTPTQYEDSKLKASSMKGLVTDEDPLIEITCSGTNQGLQEINSLQGNHHDREVCVTSRKYLKSTTAIALMIKKEGKGDRQNVFLNLVKCIQNKKSLYFAD
ncbi:hypothetical protein EI555_006084, partial [Monodon monoceros]